MDCPFCEAGVTKVMETRKKGDGYYRRRECLDCGERFMTHEVNQSRLINLLEKYLPERLVDEISHSLAKSFPEEEDS